jgi:hypothetical protein
VLAPELSLSFVLGPEDLRQDDPDGYQDNPREHHAVEEFVQEEVRKQGGDRGETGTGTILPNSSQTS